MALIKIKGKAVNGNNIIISPQDISLTINDQEITDKISFLKIEIYPNGIVYADVKFAIDEIDIETIIKVNK